LRQSYSQTVWFNWRNFTHNIWQAWLCLRRHTAEAHFPYKMATATSVDTVRRHQCHPSYTTHLQ